MARPSFSSSSFLVRWVIALVLVFASFNPTSYSYFRWVTGDDGGNLPLKALVGVVLAIGYVIFLRATWRSIGPIGVGLAAALLGALVWVMVDSGWLNLHEPKALTWVILFVLATILGVGISWSHIRRRVTGQADIDDVDE